jgi:hypothetical protein
MLEQVKSSSRAALHSDTVGIEPHGEVSVLFSDKVYATGLAITTISLKEFSRFNGKVLQ